MMYMAPAKVVPMQKSIPTAPPNSGPSARDIMKYDPGQLNKLIPVYVVDVIDVEDYDDGVDVEDYDDGIDVEDYNDDVDVDC